MKVSEQIISVLNALCEKFGLAVDWTAANVLPYVQNLCGRVVTFSIAESIAYIVFAIVFLAISFFGFKFMLKKGAADCWDSEGWMIGAAFTGIAFGFCLLVCLIGIPIWTMDIIQACTIPELTVIETIEALIESKG